MEYAEEILNLRRQGLSFQEISEKLKEKEIDIPWYIIKNICKRICRKKGIQVISDDEIYDLREKNFSYFEIVEYFKKIGIETSYETIRKRCKAIYNEKGIKEPETKRRPFIKKELPENEIYNLREQGFSYNYIVKRLKEKGIEVSWGTVKERCREIYEKKGKEEPKFKRGKEIIDISDEEIYNLREQRLSYIDIAKIFEDKKIDVPWRTIRYRCKKLYEQNGKEEIDLRKNRKPVIKISDEELYELREKGLSYRKIVKYLKDKDIDVSYETVRMRCKTIYKLIEKNDSEITQKKEIINNLDDKERVRKNLLKLRETRNATDEQLKKMAGIYGIDIDKKDIDENDIDKNDIDENVK